MKHRGYEILQFSLCEGWVNNLYDGNEQPLVFAKLKDALSELQEEFDDWANEIVAGMRGNDEGYDICEFRIFCTDTGKNYELGFNDGVVMILH